MNNEVDIEILNDKNKETSIIVSLNELNSLKNKEKSITSVMLL